MPGRFLFHGKTVKSTRLLILSQSAVTVAYPVVAPGGTGTSSDLQFFGLRNLKLRKRGEFIKSHTKK
jgi:hypothetical protein